MKENTKTPKANFQARSKLTVSDQRIHYAKVAPEAYDLLENVSAYADKSGLPRNLLELVKLKASLLNGCIYCIKYHSAQARYFRRDRREGSGCSVPGIEFQFTPMKKRQPLHGLKS